MPSDHSVLGYYLYSTKAVLSEGGAPVSVAVSPSFLERHLGSAEKADMLLRIAHSRMALGS